jgi:hypothetical protein
LNTRPKLIISNYDIKVIEECFLIRESELHEAYIHEEMAKRCGYPPYMMHRDMTVDGIVNEIMFKCIDKVMDKAKAFVKVEVDHESHYPEIVVKGTLHVGVKQN